MLLALEERDAHTPPKKRRGGKRVVGSSVGECRYGRVTQCASGNAWHVQMFLEAFIFDHGYYDRCVMFICLT